MVHYVGTYVVVDPTVIEAERDEWKTTLLNMRDTIKNNLLSKIPTSTEFEDKIADASSDAWESFVNPSWPDADFAKLKQRIKLKGAYNSWKTGVENAFAPNGAFDLGVNQKADKWLLAKYVIGSVGLRWKLGWKVAYKAIGTISGDSRVLRYATGEDSWSPAPEVVNVFLSGAAKFVRAQAVPIITRGLVLAQYALDAGDTSLADNVVNAINNVLGNTVKKQIDTTTYPNADIYLERTDTTLKVHAKSE